MELHLTVFPYTSRVHVQYEIGETTQSSKLPYLLETISYVSILSTYLFIHVSRRAPYISFACHNNDFVENMREKCYS